MRPILSATAVAAALALSAGAPVKAQEQPRDRPRVAVTVVTLDQLRQIQERYGRAGLDGLGAARWGRFDWAPPVVEPELFGSCVDARMEHGLDYCIRFYLTRATIAADAAPAVVVVFDDQPGEGPHRIGGETMRVSCFGRGVVAADAAAQDTWLWPGAERVHGVRDLDRDLDALAACVSAAASEPWTGLRQPDPR